MAKKVVATLKKEGGPEMVKVIRTIKSAKSGAYTFREEIVSTERVQDILAKK